MKASELIIALQTSIAKLGDREVVAHDANEQAVEQSVRQFQVITYGDDAAKDTAFTTSGKPMPFEIWCHQVNPPPLNKT